MYIYMFFSPAQQYTYYRVFGIRPSVYVSVCVCNYKRVYFVGIYMGHRERENLLIDACLSTTDQGRS